MVAQMMRYASVPAEVEAVALRLGAKMVRELEGGSTNRAFMLTTNDGPVVARLNTALGSVLRIDREGELNALAQLSHLNFVPKVRYDLSSPQCLVYAWCAGRHLTSVDFENPDTIVAVASALRTLHSQPKLNSTFDVGNLLESYLDACAANSSEPPSPVGQTVRTLAPLLRNLRRAVRTAPCHNDPLPKNWLITDPGCVRLIDFEFAGNNDPAFDIATVIHESGLSEQAAKLMHKYYGSTDEEKYRVDLWRLAIDAAWGLYSWIQADHRPEVAESQRARATWRFARLHARLTDRATLSKLRTLSRETAGI